MTVIDELFQSKAEKEEKDTPGLQYILLLSQICKKSQMEML